MERREKLIRTICKLTLALVIALSVVPAIQNDDSAAVAGDHCSSFPKVCRYTWDPVEHCCVADPRFDCYDVCF